MADILICSVTANLYKYCVIVVDLPEITTPFRDREVRVKTRVEVTCEAIGEPRVSHDVWRGGNGTLIQNKTDGRLVFRAIQRDEGCKLYCAAGSYLGEGKKKYIHLFVRGE